MYKFVSFLLFAMTATFSYAESAHQHGIALLDIVISDQELLVELHSPANNILGFEHQPRTEKQQQQLSNSLSLLKQAETLYLISTPAECTLQQVQIENPFESIEHEEHEEHSNINVSYFYHCQQVQHLKSINSKGLFKHFPNIETLQVQWVNENKQSAKTLSQTDTLIEFDE